MSSHALGSKGRHLATVGQVLFYNPMGYSQQWIAQLFSKWAVHICKYRDQKQFYYRRSKWLLQQWRVEDFRSGSNGKASAYNVGDPGSILGWEDLLEKEMATHSSILAWRMLWTEEPGRLQCMGSQKVRHDWATSLSQWSVQRPGFKSCLSLPTFVILGKS